MLDNFNRALRGRLNEISRILTRSIDSTQPYLYAKIEDCSTIKYYIKLLFKLKSYSRKGNNLVYLKSIAYFSVEFNRKGRAMFTFVYISLEAEELLFFKN